MPPKKRAADDEGHEAKTSDFKKYIAAYAATSTARTSSLSKLQETVVKKEEPDNAGLIVTKNTLMWFRTDLRLQDNTALHAASIRAKVGNSFLVGLYIISPEEWRDHDEAPVKIDFWMRNLHCLRESLEKLAIPLVIKTAIHKDDIPGIVQSVVEDMYISHVFWNAELLVDERKRDASVKKALLARSNVQVEECDDQCIVPPADVRTKTGNPYAVFTPFYNTWCKLVDSEPHYLELSQTPERNPPEIRTTFAQYFDQNPPSSYPHTLDINNMKELYPAGESQAHRRLDSFIKNKASRYQEGRDIPQLEGTSVLSPYLAAGVISARQCVAAARTANKGKLTTGDEGLKTWIKEVGWREFYRHIVVAFPRVSKSHAFQPKTETVEWSDNEEHFQRWCQGKTGFPIVDAGMRQLNSIGYMHNRLRMITACFLVKDLLINWQQGEKYFMSQLIDGDLPSNNGGWQWSASTGTDAQPYFRVFNPLLQSQRFDAKGDFIRRWVPELKSLNDKQIHNPHGVLSPKEFAKLRYPKPIVDHASAKAKYIAEFKRVLALA
ncbi:deoxyribodipyrimidine photo-lyase [Entomortierella parvispora]|uniref:Deoxyribodipyrimidine photo-lyase n=1 Tax=Entomortierella parvispora TaxID=205924 RepID=A0A9P3M003_9FUNG|nr:deoxyribodipyrimidine photo-lyase [Entomortierella parvispora]